MKQWHFFKTIILVTLISAILFVSAGSALSAQSIGDKRDLSLKMEVQHAIEKGLIWLKAARNPKGYWSMTEHPALTGLVLTAFMGDPSKRYKAQRPDFIQKSYDFILKNVKPDGGIYHKYLANYNTAVAMVALQVANQSSYKPILQKARNFLVGLQGDFNEKGVIDSPFDGGLGYGGRYKHSDMSNTVLALEAFYYTNYLRSDADESDIELKKLNWPAVIKFLERSQNLPSHNDQSWASDDPQNKGGFIYFPGNSKAGEAKLPSGKTVLRSYGSISYAGLLSYIYADMDRDDPRVKGVFDWLQSFYTLEENPGMGAEGLYYYYHTMAKALSIYGVDELVLKDGRKVNWRKDLALKFLDLQNADGSWVNTSGRWWERDPVLVTSYAVIAMEIIYRGL